MFCDCYCSFIQKASESQHDGNQQIEHELDHDIQTIVVFFKHYGVIAGINWTIS
jgi:hypothetical protein